MGSKTIVTIATLKRRAKVINNNIFWIKKKKLFAYNHISSAELCRINEHQKVALDLDPYVKKLLNARRRVVLVNNILQNAQERLRRLNHNVAKETARRKTMLEASGAFTPRSPSKPWCHERHILGMHHYTVLNAKDQCSRLAESSSHHWAIQSTALALMSLHLRAVRETAVCKYALITF